MRPGQQVATLADLGKNSHLHLGVRPLSPSENAATVLVRGKNVCGAGTLGYVDPIPYLATYGPGGGGGAPAEGSFVRATDNGEIYRIAGGAPIYVSDWNTVGGLQPFTDLSRAQINALPAVPRDGTFVAAAGYVYRIAGGAPIYISTWNAVGGPQTTVTIDHAAIDNAGAGGGWNHLRKYPADGTFVAAAGYVYRIAGGAPIYVSTWSAVGGAQPTVAIDHAAIDNADGGVPWNHLRKYPVDGTFVAAAGYVYRIAGGAPLYVSSWTAVGGEKPVVVVDHAAIDRADGPKPWNHLRHYPADGTLIRAGLTGAGYVVRSGIAAVTTSTSGTVVDPKVITNSGGAVPWNHLRKPPTPPVSAPGPASSKSPGSALAAPKPVSPGGATRTVVVRDRIAVYRLAGVPKGCVRPGRVFTLRASAVRRSASSGFRRVVRVDFLSGKRRVRRDVVAPYSLGFTVGNTARPGSTVPLTAEVFVQTKKGAVKKHPVRVSLVVCR